MVLSMNNIFFPSSNICTNMHIYLAFVLCLNPNKIRTSLPYRREVEPNDLGDLCTTPDSKPGECILYKSCPYIYELIMKNGRDATAAAFVRNSKCHPSFESQKPFVCCAIDDECGKRMMNYHPKMARGDNSALGNWPWMVALGYFSTKYTSRPVFKFLCGGTLISREWVLTAAHCVVGRKLTTVRLGDLDLDEEVADGASPVDLQIERNISHPKYNLLSHENDIALIRLKYAVRYTTTIRPICLPAKSEYDDSYYTDKKGTVCGWGANEQGVALSHLHEATLNYIDYVTCAKSYVEVPRARIDHRVFCAAGNGTDTCWGDSGGPMNFLRKTGTNSRYFLGGIISTGFECGLSEYPGIYTKVAAFMDWINETMASS